MENLTVDLSSIVCFSSATSELLGSVCGAYMMVHAGQETLDSVSMGFFEENNRFIAVRTGRGGDVAVARVDLGSLGNPDIEGLFAEAEVLIGTDQPNRDIAFSAGPIQALDKTLCLFEIRLSDNVSGSDRLLKQKIKGAKGQVAKIIKTFIRAGQGAEDIAVLSRLHRVLPVMLSQSRPGRIVPSVATHAKAALMADKAVIMPLSSHSDISSDFDGFVFRGMADRPAENVWLEEMVKQARKVVSSKQTAVIYHEGDADSVTIVSDIGTRDSFYGLLGVHYDDSLFDVAQKQKHVEHFCRMVGAAIESADRGDQRIANALARKGGQVAMDLHDGLAQTLFSLSLEAEIALKTLAGTKDVGKAAKQIKGMQKRIRGVIEDVRKVVDRLHPDELASVSVIGFLRRSVQELSPSTDIKFTVGVSGKQIDLPVPRKKELFRAVHEALANAVKHSGATTISVTANFAPVGITVSVGDNGIGFDLENELTALAAGRGIGNIRSRAVAMGGWADIESVANIGTRVTMFVPGGPGVGHG